MIRTKQPRGFTKGAWVMLVVYGSVFVLALLMALTETTYLPGGEDKKTVVAVTKAQYKQYKQSQSARGSGGSRGGRVYVGGGYSGGK
jgi:uncharacterized membrane protein YgcG